jgi:hypothetical protein
MRGDEQRTMYSPDSVKIHFDKWIHGNKGWRGREGELVKTREEIFTPKQRACSAPGLIKLI